MRRIVICTSLLDTRDSMQIKYDDHANTYDKLHVGAWAGATDLN